MITMPAHRSTPRRPVGRAPSASAGLPIVAPVVLALLLIGGAFAAACTAGDDERAADLVVRGGKIVTVDDALPEAEAIAVRDRFIVYVGDTLGVEAHVGPDTRVVELQDGQIAMPGFIEGHGHLMGIGRAQMQLDLMDAGSYEEVVERVEAAVGQTAPGEWILGRGWHQSKWEPRPEPMVRGFQTHEALSAVSPDNPVWLTHASGHAGFANARAMELAGVTVETSSPPGGEIIVDADGEPTGVFVETAQRLIGEALERSRADMTDEQRRTESERMLELAIAELSRKGVTSFQDAGAGPDTLAFYREARESGALDDIRLYAMVRSPADRLPEILPEVRAVGDDHLTVRAIKVTIDGALGSRGAWLLQPYADDPGNTGHNTVPLEDVRRTAELALEHRFQLCIHAIGDRANREVLDIYEAAFAADPAAAEDARWRIEHAQHIQPEDVPRFAELGVIASVQGIHCTSDGPWIPDRLGPERARATSYPWRDLIDSGALVMNGTDAPVEDVDPIASFYASVTRRMANGEVFVPEQAMTRDEALRSYTVNGAFGMFEEDTLGSLTEGKLADIVVLSRDIMTVPEEEILDAEVLYTIVGGRVVHDAGSPATAGLR